MLRNFKLTVIAKSNNLINSQVTFYGALFRQGDVWICMEVMDASLDQFYKKVC